MTKRKPRMRNTHPHRCPICKAAFECAGDRCAPYNGVPHRRCAPTNRAAKWTIEVYRTDRCPECDAIREGGKCYTNGCSLAEPEFTNYQE